jgi:hypothetical protein
LFLEILLNYKQEQAILFVAGYIVSRSHEFYFSVTLGHPCSYFLNEITLINLIHNIKYH